MDAGPGTRRVAAAIAQPYRFHAARRRTAYDFTAPTRFDKLFTGIVAPRPKWIPVADAGRWRSVVVESAMHPDTQTEAAVGISFADLLRYNESEALKWRSWLEAQPLELLDVPFGNPAQHMGNA